MAKSQKQTELVYTENELAAIEVLRAHRGEKLSAKELGIATAVLTSLGKKAEKFPDAEDVVVVYKEDFNEICSVCGSRISHKLYWIE